MNKTAIFYGSSTGNTENAAKVMAELLNADLFDVAQSPGDRINGYQNLVFGTSTWGVGDLQDDWEDFINQLADADLNGKVVALFGLGDGNAYCDSFVDAMGTIYNSIKNKGCKIVGFTETNGYEFDCSTAVVDGKFVGLPLDEENQGDLTTGRIDKWVKDVIPHLGLF